MRGLVKIGVRDQVVPRQDGDSCQATPKDEERASSKGTTADLAGGFRLAYNGGWCKEAFVHGSIRRY
jgi:hypothetical protein